MKVLVLYKSNGDGRLKVDHRIIQEIKHFYASGKICTITGDVWRVVKSPSPDADYVALME